MDHVDPQELISAYLDGEVSPKERAEAERLLEASSELRADLDDFARLSELLRGLPRESAPPELAAAIRQQAEQKALLAPEPVLVKRSLRREMISALIGVAATVLAVALVNPVLERNAAQTLFARHGNAEAPPSSLSVTSGPDHEADRSMTIALSDSTSVPELGDKWSGMQRNESQTESLPKVAALDGEAKTAATPFSTNGATPQEEASGSGGFPGSGKPFGFDARLGGELDGTPGGGVTRRTIHIGDMLPYFEKNADGVSVVELTVVDIEQVADQFHVLCERNQFSVIPEDGVPEEVAATEADKSAKRIAALESIRLKSAEKVSGGTGSDLVFYYLQAPSDNMAQLLQGLDEHPDLYVGAQVKPPVDRPFVETEELLFEDGNGEAEGVVAEREAEVAKSEANVVAQNYNFQQRQLEEAESRDGKSVNDFGESLQQKPLVSRRGTANRDFDRALRRSYSEPVLREPVDALAVANGPQSQLVARQQNAIAVPMRLYATPETTPEQPAPAVKLAEDLAKKSGSSQKARFSNIASGTTDEAVKKDDRAEPLAEQQALGKTVRLLFVLRQAPPE